MFSLRRGALVSSLAAITLASAALAAPAQPVPFSVLGKNAYFIKNYVPIQKRAYFVIEDYATFESIFGFGMYMGAPKPQISPDTFKTSMLLIPATSGPSCTLAAKSLIAKGSTATLGFASTCESASSSRQNDFLIVVVPKRHLTSVSFVENGGHATTVKAPTAPVPAPQPAAS
jgi:hypothetical protein